MHIEEVKPELQIEEFSSQFTPQEIEEKAAEKDKKAPDKMEISKDIFKDLEFKE